MHVNVNIYVHYVRCLSLRKLQLESTPISKFLTVIGENKMVFMESFASLFDEVRLIAMTLIVSEDRIYITNTKLSLAIVHWTSSYLDFSTHACI